MGWRAHLHDDAPGADGEAAVRGGPAANVHELHEVGAHLDGGVEACDGRRDRHRRGKQAHVPKLHPTAPVFNTSPPDLRKAVCDMAPHTWAPESLCCGCCRAHHHTPQHAL